MDHFCLCSEPRLNVCDLMTDLYLYRLACGSSFDQSFSGSNGNYYGRFTYDKGRFPSEMLKPMSLEDIKDIINYYVYAVKCAIP